ncbi:hypothetical protein HLH26_08115 [Gluconacetobacter sp. 1b LMG 1731]|uniref:Uncharacterized protein n=1 Tax=Gluconacetobacter dulcium TaxID=2729096 RepID=A0A7W4NVK0_9PROT|nr:hypothetical protein [Gluconacetobacter dulcium]MBB2164505.1 hypothetical protein [Gluconacetobacter dulcium]MBB2193728.1 hypothetical protein [Gluconacetobacter dulcium]
MAEGRNQVFSPADVHELATWLFWLRVRSVGVAACKTEVIESRGVSLLNRENLEFVLRADVNQKVGECLTDPAHAQDLVTAAASEAYAYCSGDANLNGMVYADEAMGGRDLFAGRFPYPDLPVAPINIEVVGASIPTMGQLLVRTPLPAAVAVRTPEVPPLFWVRDTTAALGKAYPVLFMKTGVAQLAQDLWCVHGYCNIPVPTLDWGDRFSLVIPNGMFSLERHVFTGDAGIIEARYDWR